MLVASGSFVASVHAGPLVEAPTLLFQPTLYSLPTLRCTKAMVPTVPLGVLDSGSEDLPVVVLMACA